MMTSKVKAGRLILFLCLALGGAAFDLTTKSLIFQRVGLPGSEPVALIPDVLELRTSHNTGALWGFGGSMPHSSLVFAGLSIVAGVAIVCWLFLGGAASSLPLTIALSLIMAGAMGNCYDRLAFGHVRDFVYFHVDSIHFSFAIFNFADNMLVAGALILALFALRPQPPDEPSPPTGSHESQPRVIETETVEQV
jgi:signal peptidase II